jgi:hypothetical protein
MNAWDLVARLRTRKEPAPLVPREVWDGELDAEIERSLPDSEAKSALFLWNDSLRRAHEIAQEIKTQTGSYLHGVMHRREPDYGNSKYWFERVGRHPLFPDVRAAALELVSGPFRDLAKIRTAVETSPEWDAFRMVDWCEEAARPDADPRFVAFLRTLQAREIELLASASMK